MTLQELKDNWIDEPNYHKTIHETFIENVNNDELLNQHRTWVEQNVFGFGERSFHWFWKLLIDEMPKQFSFMEVGIFRGQILSLINVLSKSIGKKATVYGVSPLDNSDGHWDSDYETDVSTIHKQFNVADKYTIYKGLSTNENIIQQTLNIAPYDIVYIDGGHTTVVVTSDLTHYPNMVKKGGYLVIDDCCNNMSMPWGFFQGISSVTNAVLEWEKTEISKEFEFQFNVVHLKVYKRVA